MPQAEWSKDVHDNTRRKTKELEARAAGGKRGSKSAGSMRGAVQWEEENTFQFEQRKMLLGV
jgi:hypothetical protein